MDDSEFLSELRQMVVRRASSMHLVDTMAFVAEVADRLQEDPVFGEFVMAEYLPSGTTRRQLKIHGFTELDESDGTISLVIGRWIDEPAPTTLLTSDIESLQGFLENFAREALAGKLDERIAESSLAYQVATTLRRNKSKISCIRLHILSNQILSSRYKREYRSEIEGTPTETHIWDFQRLKALYSSSREREMVEISLKDFHSSGIPCIEASRTDGLQSFLCVIEGNLLADLFDRYGSRLMEGNVRSFLGIKGGVNKGIRATIQDSPPLFFAYNNGIAATAVAINISNDMGYTCITDVSDLQIVNGGQTTASILRARKQDKLSLTGVTVPMKLTVVARDRANDLIPKIAEFANTQNKVAIADFFANHAFHRKMEQISRRLLVPARAEMRIQSKWFYERSRGQYQNERLYLSKARKDAFDLEYPANQVINKTELAKYDSTIREKPHWVSFGAQKNFIKFAAQFESKGDRSESEYWTEISPQYGDIYYQTIVGMAILWAKGEEIVNAGRNSWYLGDYRPLIVAYAWAAIFHSMRLANREPNLLRAWERQNADEVLSESFKNVAVQVQHALLDLPQGSSDAREWAKREACWQKVADIRLNLGSMLNLWSVDRAESKRALGDARRQGEQDDGIFLQKEIVELSASGYWSALAVWPRTKQFVFGPELTLLSKASTAHGVLKISSIKDWKKLIELKKRCEDEGFRHQ